MTKRIRILAGLALALSLALPLSSVPVHLSDTPRSYHWVLSDVIGDWGGIPLLLIAFLWPFALLAISRKATRGISKMLVALAEPLAALFSSYMILMMVDLSFEFRNLFVIFWLPVSARAEIGCYTALAANALYAGSWLWERTARRSWPGGADGMIGAATRGASGAESPLG